MKIKNITLLAIIIAFLMAIGFASFLLGQHHTKEQPWNPGDIIYKCETILPTQEKWLFPKA